MSQITELASSQINPAGDSIVVELVHPTDYPAMVRITWPNHSTTVTAPNTYPEIAGAITMAPCSSDDRTLPDQGQETAMKPIF